MFLTQTFQRSPPRGHQSSTKRSIFENNLKKANQISNCRFSKNIEILRSPEDIKGQKKVKRSLSSKFDSIGADG